MTMQFWSALLQTFAIFLVVASLASWAIVHLIVRSAVRSVGLTASHRLFCSCGIDAAGLVWVDMRCLRDLESEG